MANTVFLRENSPSVTSDYADGEVVIINLESGAYFGLESTGAAIWMRILNGLSIEGIKSEIHDSTGSDDETIDSQIDSFLEELAKEALVVGMDSPSGGEASSETPDFPSPYQAPVLNKYTDMDELLLIDPVHEVDERGWPNLKPG